jgi:hypothetical protein
MEQKLTNNKKLVKPSEHALLTLVSSKLKEEILFPKKIEIAKDFLNNLQTKSLKKV